VKASSRASKWVTPCWPFAMITTVAWVPGSAEPKPFRTIDIVALRPLAGTTAL